MNFIKYYEIQSIKNELIFRIIDIDDKSLNHILDKEIHHIKMKNFLFFNVNLLFYKFVYMITRRKEWEYNLIFTSLISRYLPGIYNNIFKYKFINIISKTIKNNETKIIFMDDIYREFSNLDYLNELNNFKEIEVKNIRNSQNDGSIFKSILFWCLKKIIK